MTPLNVNKMSVSFHFYHFKYICWPLFNQQSNYFLKIGKISALELLELNLHSGGPKSKKSNFEDLKSIFRNCLKAHLFLSESKCFSKNINDEARFLIKITVKSQTYILGVPKKKKFNFVIREKYKATNTFSNKCPGKNFV